MILAGDPCLSVLSSTDLTGECSVGNLQLCGQHCTELIISEELHNEKTCKPHSHHKNLAWVLNGIYARDHRLFVSMLNSDNVPNTTEPALSETSCKPAKSMSWLVSLLVLIFPSPETMW